MPSKELSPFVIGAERTQVLGDGGASAESFAQCRAIMCPKALDPPFLTTLLKITRAAQFAPDPVDRVGQREIETPNIAGAALTLALRRSNLIRWIEETTQCGPLGSIDGCVAQIRPVAGHGLRWHDDLNTPERRLAITIDLSEQTYEGGLFELRLAKTKEVLLRFRHAMPGSALIFDVSPGLDHRVLPLTSGGPRRVYAGWFLKRKQT
jgi:hypothetical protein